MADLVVAMDVRMAIAFACCSPEPVNVTAFCAEHGISRQTFYVYRRRFAEQGVQGVLPICRRPRSSPNQTTEVMTEAVVAMHDQLREEGWDAGARSVRDRLLLTGLAGLRSDRTVHRILKAHQRVKPAPRKRRRDSFHRFESAAPNGMWQLDGTQAKLADGTVVHVLHQDDHSRMLLATLVAPAENSAAAIEVLTVAMQRHGRPAALLHDGAMGLQRPPPWPGPDHRSPVVAGPAGGPPDRLLSLPPTDLRQEGTRVAGPAPVAGCPPHRRQHRRAATAGRRLRRCLQPRTHPSGHRPGHSRRPVRRHHQSHPRDRHRAAEGDLPP